MMEPDSMSTMRWASSVLLPGGASQRMVVPRSAMASIRSPEGAACIHVHASGRLVQNQ